jgi:integrase
MRARPTLAPIRALLSAATAEAVKRLHLHRNAHLPDDHPSLTRAELHVMGHCARRALTLKFPPPLRTLTAVLAARPLRLRNLAGLVLDRTPSHSPTDGWIQIPATATKTKDPIELPWPDVLVPALETCLSQHRPILAAMRGRWSRPSGGALWLSTDGSSMTRIAIYDRIIARTREGLDRPVNPHLFRDCAVTSIAIEDQFHVRVATRLLGRRTAATTERYYNQGHSIEAARRQKLMVGIRNGTIKLGRDEEDHS